MITPAYSPTATERVLPRMALDFTTGVLDSRVTIARALNTATRVNSNGFIETVNANLPRFDYDPSTNAAKGLLIEEARSNLVLQSAFASGWTGAQMTSTPNTLNSPDGTLTATTLTGNSSSGIHTVFQLVTTASGTTYSTSIFLKKGTGRYITLSLIDTGFTGARAATFDLDTGAVTQSGAYGVNSTFVSASSTVSKDGFWRLTVVGSNTAASTYIQICGSNAGTFTPDTFGRNSYSGSTLTWYAWGAQVEAGAFATSYIPTTTTSLTRNADIVSMTGTNFSSWYNSSGGSFVFEGSALSTLGFAYLVLASDNTNTNRFGSYKSGAGVTGLVTSSGGTQMEITGTSLVANVPFKAAVAAQTNNGNFSSNGSIGTTDTAIAMPTVNQLTIGSFQNVSPLNGHARAVRYYLPRLINAELQAFSK